MNINNVLMQCCYNVVFCGVGQIYLIFVEWVENCWVWDVEGCEYFDFVGGIVVLNIGYLYLGIVLVVEVQLKKLFYICFQVLVYELYLVLCECMNQKVLGDFVKKMLLVMIGLEVVENVVKIVCVVIKCSGVIVFSGVYYGCIYYMFFLIGKVYLYFVGMGLMSGYVYCVFYFCLLYNISDDDVIVSIECIFKNDVVLEDIVVIIIELVQGEGGFYVVFFVFMQ